MGTIGLLQALEALKITLGMSGVLSGRLLLFDGTDTTFRNVKLRPKNAACSICGDNPTIHELIDYEQFCGAKANDKNPNLKLLNETERITVQEYSKLFDHGEKLHLLIDVRSHEEFDICKLNDSVNVPFLKISKREGIDEVQKEITKIANGDAPVDGKNEIVFR